MSETHLESQQPGSIPEAVAHPKHMSSEIKKKGWVLLPKRTLWAGTIDVALNTSDKLSFLFCLPEKLSRPEMSHIFCPWYSKPGDYFLQRWYLSLVQKLCLKSWLFSILKFLIVMKGINVSVNIEVETSLMVHHGKMD